eukprot:s4497_g1.t1
MTARPTRVTESLDMQGSAEPRAPAVPPARPPRLARLLRNIEGLQVQSRWAYEILAIRASLMLLCSPWRMLLSSLSSSFEGDLKQISIRPIRWAQGGSPWHDVARVQRPACNLSRCTKALGVARCTLANAGP